MEVVASVVGGAVVETGRVRCGSIYYKIKNTVKFQSNLNVLEKEMKPLLALRDGVKNETKVAKKEGKVLTTQVIEWLKEVEELQLKVNQIQAVKLSQRSLNCSKRYRISREVAEKLKEIEGLLKAGSSHSSAVAVNHSMPRAVEHVPGPSIEDQTTQSKTLANTMTLSVGKSLRSLVCSGMSVRLMPGSVSYFYELRSLVLADCLNLEELPSLEGLSKLEVLDVSGTRIRELPRNMEKLSNLKQLNLSRTYYLETIQAGIISRLSCLEVLNMTGSDYCFNLKRDVQEEMTCFEEIKCLERLHVLCIRLERIPYLSSEDLSWMDRLRQFYFSVGPQGRFVAIRHKRMVSISNLDLSLEKPIGPLLSNASSLDLYDCLGLSDMLEDLVIKSVGSYAGLKFLTIQHYSGIVWRGGCAAQYDLLPNLEELHLRHVNYGESISELLGRLGLRFLRLKSIQVEWCSKMKYLLSCGDFIHALPNLEVIKVRYCDWLGELFSYHSIPNITPDPVVPNLRILELVQLPELRTLCREEETWPLLEEVHVFGCDLVRKLPLADKNAENIKEIKGESHWWNTLEWHADTTKSSLRPYFHPI